MAEEVFELSQIIAASRSRKQGSALDLSETEFLALDALAKEEPLTIGDVQKRVGVVPAQMSRVVRSLEREGGRGYVDCRINPDDRRCVDLWLTKEGREAYTAYRAARLASMKQFLTVLEPADRPEFMRMLSVIRLAFSRSKPD
jgi:DNA-binding MarR family transcriptional regulator